MIYNVILCLGDSITSGSRDEYRRGYPAELARLLKKEYPGQAWIMVNEGANGETSANLLRRAYKTIRSYPEANMVLLMTGTNDAKEGVPAELFEDNLRQITDILKCLSKRFILALLPPIRGMGLMEYPSHNQKYIEEYNKLIPKYSDLIADMTGLDALRIDKIHFSNDGYREMAGIWLRQIKKS